LLLGLVFAGALALAFPLGAAEDVPVGDGLAPVAEVPGVVGVEVVAARLNDGMFPPDAEVAGEAADVLAEAEDEATGAGTTSGPLALAALFRLATTAITSTSTKTAEPSTRTRRIQ
jgi:hypothetical protein